MRIKNKETKEILTFTDDWEVVGEKKKPLIKGAIYIDAFKKWATCCGNNADGRRNSKQFIYEEARDILKYDACNIKYSYGISFDSLCVYEDLKDGEKYSYNELVGEE